MKPFKFKYNRVRRSYTGGKGIDLLRNATAPADNEYPEDWIASTVSAYQRPGEQADTGISIIADSHDTKFSVLLEQFSEELLGKKHVEKFGAETGFLMKLLDSAIRLPVQVHPDKATAQKLFRSGYGKTEAWLILGSRPIDTQPPYLLIGFNEKLDRDLFIKESLTGQLDKSLDMMHRIAVKPGDVFMITGGLPHAIGPGLTLVEIMEPSDWVVVSERCCGAVTIPDLRRFNGLPPQQAMEIFDFTPRTREQLLDQCYLVPLACDASLDTLIERNDVHYFGLQKLSLQGSYCLKNHETICRAGIVINGNMTLNGLSLQAGDTFFLPAAISEYYFIGSGEIILALPPTS